MTTPRIAEISRSYLQHLNTPSLASITNVEHLSSYNWIEAPTPTIAVPGCPPSWSPPKVSKRLNKDSGLVYIAQNAARHPDSPLEPLFRALYIANPSYDIRSIDVVTDRNNLRKLLSFINPGSTRNGLSPFAIKIEVTNNTAIFCRQEPATCEIIGPEEFRGYGHEFEKAYTADQISGSTGHHRVISYCFADLKFIVRHETDGYVKLDADKITRTPKSKEQENDSLSGLLDSLSLSSPNNCPTSTHAGSKLTIREEGLIVPLSSTLELKTRVSHKPLQLQEIIPQLWASQTPKLVRAYHIKGTFQVPAVEDVTVQVRRWEEDNQHDLRRLAGLIGMIVEMVKGCGGHATLKYDDTGDELVLWEAGGDMMLPMDLYSKWDCGSNSEDAGTESAVEHVEAVDTKVDGKGPGGKIGRRSE
ncbi:hypothetical protein D0Z07_0976 [Hyphodiscus hymeniophilus]|uniref:Geranylgeranyl pyrophosphate synthetase n=1 Tax=Hyphodiscus hymeniophilus TaxID=353542 RepID=A0A9P6VPK2_9HELO|nr:hypothetical protein D0Z07_0976 [Hyphodiscus hymeniophilus]